VSHVLSHSDRETSCGAAIHEAHPYLKDGRVDAVIALELMAQTIAARGGLAAHDPDTVLQPQTGYVLGAPSLEFLDGDFHLNDQLEITVRLVQQLGAMAQYEGEVRVSGSLRARGTLSVYVGAAQTNSRPKEAQP